MIVYGPEVKDSRPGGNESARPCVVAKGGKGRRMPTSLDSLLVALLVALGPVEQEFPAGAENDRSLDGFRQGYHQLTVRPEQAGRSEGGACRYFIDAQARRNCEIRTTRALSGAAEPSYPSQVIYLAPSEPGMPFKFPTSTFR